MITTIVIPVLNRHDLLTRCIDSIPDRVENILVIDNGDAYETTDARTRVLRMPSNLGVPASWNLGIKLYPHESGWVLLNSDAWLDDGALDTLEAECAPDNVVLAGNPPWCCAWIGADVVDRVGLFSEVFYPAYMEDVDYEERCHRLGISIVSSAARIGHDNSSTIRSDESLRRHNDRTHQVNNALFAQRWSRLSQLGVPLEQEWRLSVRRHNAWDTPAKEDA